MATIGSPEKYISVLNMGNSICIQMAIRAAIELDVFNIIARSGPNAYLTSKEIVSKIPTTNPNKAAQNLERLLNLLSVNSLLSTKREEPKAYALTKEALYLLPNEEGVSLTPIILSGSEMHVVKSFYMLKYSVLEPESVPFHRAHDGESFYDFISREKKLPLFNEMMRMFSYINFEEKMLKVYEGFGEVEELLDVGGGDGSSLAKVVSMYPHIHGINFDLPHADVDAPQHQGVKHATGDMFESIPKAQSIMLKWVLHNWDDELCKKILRNCWDALPENGKVIVVEYFMLPEELDNSQETKMMLEGDVFMMALFDGGKERTVAEIESIAKSAGFTGTKVFPISNGTHVIELLKN